jgi:hypothetical protein
MKRMKKMRTVRLIEGFNYNTWYYRLKIPVLNAYGGGCTWEEGCDVDLECMLQIDHVLRSGADHARELGYKGSTAGSGVKILQDLRDKHYPPGCRVLCANHHASVTYLNPISKIREEAHEHYGWICACCGHNIARELQVDHIKDDGFKHKEQVHGYKSKGYRNDDGLYAQRRGSAGDIILKDLEKRGWPQGIVQFLCANCNQAKRRFKNLCPSWAHSGEQSCITESRCTTSQMLLPM